jgi:hypothetical protein
MFAMACDRIQTATRFVALVLAHARDAAHQDRVGLNWPFGSWNDAQTGVLERSVLGFGVAAGKDGVSLPFFVLEEAKFDIEFLSHNGERTELNSRSIHHRSRARY